ncbi:uncharacterized protein LOC121633512 isoform X2 [Melanotaenia boesemani]|uniref:uncharacterized protein LOC121633512 isoform X2 n=1 Tax=Melanotaenia boesemani TaxID=1250792 RepID=UPI001C046FDC|nr:uncharacterized protein LOC121633512 isoform X2 [Melanotaenia boesemani]
MFGLKSFKLSLLLTWMLPFTAETQQFSNTTATVGDDVTLTCEGFREFNDQCFSTTWIYSDSVKTVTLYEKGKIHREAGSKSDRLNVTEKCFLVIKKVTVEDEGHYFCRQFESSGRQVTDSRVQLSVTNRRTSSPVPPMSTPPSTGAKTETHPGCWWRTVYVPVGVAALSIIVVSVSMWTRLKKVSSDEDDDEDGVRTHCVHIDQVLLLVCLSALTYNNNLSLNI